MLQVLQDLKDGKTFRAEVPAPSARANEVLIRTRATLISAGTERMLLDFGRASWIDKARQQPDKVRQVFEKVRTDGLMTTVEAVRAKLDQPIPLGYSNAGMEVGTGVRMASNGPHAEVVSVPKNLCARIPDGVSDEAAAFTVLGAIALEGIRLAQPTLGETFAVMGLGLIGQITVQLLRANGCRVVGIDPDAGRLALAARFGAETAAAEVDGVLITASTKSDEVVHQAAQMCRKRGRIVLVGVTGLNLRRDDFYKKELSFQVSCSYGPGRYDPAYEEGGQDYPIGFVRWTVQRNFEAVLQMMAEGKLDVAPLITHRFPFSEAAEAYRVLVAEPCLGILLEYGEASTKTILPLRRGGRGGGIGVIGAGQHSCRVLLPALGGLVKVVADSNGAAAAYAARKFGAESASTDAEAVLGDPEIGTVVIATRHDSHCRLVCAALRAGKNVFVEKPLALRASELAEIEAAYSAGDGILMVGFNRRFAPQIVKMKELLAGPKSMVMTVNAGAVPLDHWTLDPEKGGGRIIGEACHFIDLLRHLAGAGIVSANAARLNAETVTISLGFADGSVGAVHYFANGSKAFPKERLEVFCGGRILQLDNFRKLTGYGWPGFRKMNLWRQDKGHAAGVAAFLEAVREGKPSPIPFEELIEVAGVTFSVS